MDKKKQIEEMAAVVEEVQYLGGLEQKVALRLSNAGYGNLKEFAKNVIAILDKEMSSLEMSEAGLEKENNHEGAILMQVRYWEVHRLKEEIAKLIKEYAE